MPADPISSTSNGTSEKRVALVIGNGKYENAATLDNPPHDARAMAQMLSELNFEVVDGYDLDVEAMDSRINDFARRIDEGGTALFFYAGHGLQVDGENYLVPVDAELDNEGQLQRQTIRLQDQLNMMSNRAAVSILLLDCCRDNPFVRSLTGRRIARTRGGVARGLAEVGIDEGSFIAFATGPGSVANDGDGEHSPFTEALLQRIGAPDQSLADIMTDVTDAVTEATNEQQVPWYHSSLRKRFFFRRTIPLPVPPLPQPAPEPPAPAMAAPSREVAVETGPPAGTQASRPTPLVSGGDSSYKAATEATPDKPKPRTLTSFIVAGLAVLAGAGGFGVYYSRAPSTPVVPPRQDHGPAGDRPDTAASLIGRLNTLDQAGADRIAAFVGNGATPFDQKRSLVHAVAVMAQYQVYTVKATDPVPANCRAPTPARPGDDDVTLVCSGLDGGGQALLLDILAAVPAAIWADPGMEAERRLALLAAADLAAAGPPLSAQAGKAQAGKAPVDWPIDELKRNLRADSRPADLVTLQFAGSFLRGNAQLIMDRLVAFGWNLKGVQRAPNAAGLNEIRYGSTKGAGDDASALAGDLALQGLAVAPKAAAAIGTKQQLDIYISTPLATWTDGPPQFAWCYQEFDGSKDPASRYLLACHPSRPACLDARGNAPAKSQSDCTFEESLGSAAVKLRPGGWGNSWFAQANTGFPAPFPPLPQ